MFKNLFKPKPVDFAAPFKGRIMTLDEVPDPVFSNKSMGGWVCAGNVGGQGIIARVGQNCRGLPDRPRDRHQGG